jgi:biopolymer transport protein ExbD
MAAGTSAPGPSEAITGINVTPFVDIALVLLIIFMVTAKYLVAMSIPVELPRAASGEQTELNTLMNVSVDAQGNIFVDARPVDEDGLQAAAVERVRNNPETRVVINADRAVTHGRVTEVIDRVRLGGISRFAIQTERSADARARPGTSP